MKIACLVAVVIALSVVGLVPADAAIGCGASITHNVTLTHDIKHCAFDGLDINADNVVVNLNGHTLTGESGNVYTGVRAGGYNGIVVKNGTIKGFGGAVEFDYATGGQISGITSAGDPIVGIDLCGTNDIDVHGNHISGADGGIELNCAPASGNQVKGNTVTGATGAGVLLNGANFNTVHGNVFKHDETGVQIDTSAHNNTVSGNTATDDVDFGYHILSGAYNNVLQNNKVSSGGSHGILVEGASSNNSLLGNRSTGNASDGIEVTSNPTGTILRGNTANGNLSDGIAVLANDSATHLGDNVANNNGSYGILAVTGVTDDGGNTASGNGAANCAGAVTC
jgi:parallel beta-helix repeat protein